MGKPDLNKKNIQLRTVTEINPLASSQGPNLMSACITIIPMVIMTTTFSLDKQNEARALIPFGILSRVVSTRLLYNDMCNDTNLQLRQLNSVISGKVNMAMKWELKCKWKWNHDPLPWSWRSLYTYFSLEPAADWVVLVFWLVVFSGFLEDLSSFKVLFLEFIVQMRILSLVGLRKPASHD